MTPILTCTELTRVYQTQAGPVPALRGIDMQIAAGEMVAIMGPSGSGKSTLMHLLGGLDRPTGGQILLDGQVYGSLSERDLTLLRRKKIGFVFQAFNLVPTLTAEENILLPLLLDGRRENRPLLQRLLSDLGLKDRAAHKPAQLSGGQQQRVALARALVTEPALVLADEPTGNLDSRTADEILGSLRRSCSEFGRTVVMVTHDAKVAANADRILTIRDGRLVGDTVMGGMAGARSNLARLAESL